MCYSSLEGLVTGLPAVGYLRKITLTRFTLTCRGLDHALTNGEYPEIANNLPMLMKQVIVISIIWLVWITISGVVGGCGDKVEIYV